MSMNKDEVQRGSAINIATAMRKKRNPIQSLKGDLYSQSSDDSSSSIDSEEIEWRLGDYIDSGSIGAVYRALDWNTAKLITVKFLDVKDLSRKQKDDIVERLKEQVEKVKAMRDPNIVRYINVTETDDEEGMIAISMEYVPGGSITYLLKFFKSFKEPLVKIYVNQVVKVLWRLHKKGLVHRDIKTSNLLVDDLGTIKLSDFGFIKEIYEEFWPHNTTPDIDTMLNKDLNENFELGRSDQGFLDAHDVKQLSSNMNIKPLINSFYYWPPEVHLKKCFEEHPSYDIWSLGWVCYEMLTGEMMMYDYTNPDSIRIPDNISKDCRDFLKCCLDFDPKKRSNINELLWHKFLMIEDKQYKESQETINFLSLYSLVAMNESNVLNKKKSESMERLSILQKKSKYISRDSGVSSYKITPELSRALGISFGTDKKASLRQIHLDIENLKRYSRSSVMIRSLTNVNPDDLKLSHGSSSGNEDGQFESSKLALVLKKIQNNK